VHKSVVIRRNNTVVGNGWYQPTTYGVSLSKLWFRKLFMMWDSWKVIRGCGNQNFFATVFYKFLRVYAMHENSKKKY